MAKALWFLFGFLFALVLGALMVVVPMAGIRASIAPPSAQPQPVAAPADSAPPDSAPADPADITPARAEGLRWVRQGTIEPPLGACSQLVIDYAWQIRYGPCDEGSRLAYMTEAELAWYQAYLLTLAPFEYAGAGVDPSRATVKLSFAGQGDRQATPQEQAHLSAWAEQVYMRVMGQEQQASLLAQARLDLMAWEQVRVGAIQVLEIVPVRWPDACLGLRQEATDCARVATQGYHIVLAVEGRAFEYRADVYGQVRPVRGYPSHLVVPPLTP